MSQPLPQYFRKPYQQFDGGLCSRPDPQVVPASKFVQLDEAVLAEHDILEKAPGYIVDGQPWDSTPGNFIRMLVNYKSSGDANSIVVSSNDSTMTGTYTVDFKQSSGNGVYNYIGYTTGTAVFNGTSSVVGTGTAWLTNLKVGDKIGTGTHPGTFRNITAIADNTHLTMSGTLTGTGTYMAIIALSQNFNPVGLVFNDFLVIANGSEKLMEYDNVTMTLIPAFDTAFPGIRPKFLEKHKNRLFLATEDTIYWSHTNNETAYEPDSLEPVFPSDNGAIVQIKSFAGCLFVFKDNGLIYKVVGEFDQGVSGSPTSIVAMETPDNLGIIAGQSVVKNDDNQLYFLSETGFYTIDPWYLQFKKISWDIQPDISRLIFKSAATTQLQFLFNSSAQFDSGTYSGTKTSATGQLTTFNDRLAFSPSSKIAAYPSQAIDSSNNVHSIVAMTVPGTGRNPDGSIPGSTGSAVYTQLSSTGATIQEYLSLGSIPPITSIAGAVSAAGNFGFVYASPFPTYAFPGADPTYTSTFINYMERVTAGTATFTNGSKTVTGSGTFWSSGTANLIPKPGSPSTIKNEADGSFASISTVNSDTSITLSAPYTGTSGTAVSYVAWQSPTELSANISYSSRTDNWGEVSVKFVSDDPVILSVSGDNGGTGNMKVKAYKRTAGVFSTVNIVSPTDGNSYRASLAASGANLTASFTLSNTVIRAYHSTDGGASWTLVENFNVGLGAQDTIQAAFDGSGGSQTGYGIDGNSPIAAMYKRDHSITTTVQLETIPGESFTGYSFYASNDYAMSNGSGFERYVFLSVKSVQDSVARLATAGNRLGQGALDNNGPVFSSISLGINSNEVVIRRISFSGTWTTAVSNDSTLSQWGLFTITGENDNMATVLQEIALGTTSSLGSFNPITSGALVSTNPAQVFFQLRTTFTIGSLSAPVIGSISLAYLGAGADSRTIFSFVFNNEMYTSCTDSQEPGLFGNTGNNTVIFLDRKSAWGKRYPNITQMARMNQNFYAGSSNNGYVYKMNVGLGQFYNNDTNGAYSLVAVTKEDLLGSIELLKDVSKVYVLYRAQASGTFTFSYRLDSYKTPGGSAWTDTVIDQTTLDPLIGGFEVPVQQRCSSIQFKVIQADSGVQIGFIGFVVLYGNNSGLR